MKVVVCGGGIIGIATAQALAASGAEVVLVERGSEGADTCMHGSAGYISPSHIVPLSAPGMIGQGLRWMLNRRSPFYVKPRLDLALLRWSLLFARSCSNAHTRKAAPILRDLTAYSRASFEQLALKYGPEIFEFRPDGLLNLFRSQEVLDHEVKGLVRIAGELGVEARVLDARRTVELEPQVRLDVIGSIFFPGDAHLSPRKLAPVMLAAAKRSGVRFCWDTQVKGWETAAGGRVTAVQTGNGPIKGDAFVLAAGSWSPGMVRGLAIRLPMEAGKGYSLTVPVSRHRVHRPLMLTERRIAITPMGPSLRFGGTMELSGINHTIRPERVRQIIESVPLYLPDVAEADFAEVIPWVGLRPVSPDGLPYIGRFHRHPNLVAACGHAMLGLTMAPITAQLVAEILTDRPASVPLAMLAPDRFS